MRKEDNPSLANFFVEKYSKEMNKVNLEIEFETLEILNKYEFPRNIRELENIVERMVIFTTNGKISPERIPKDVVRGVYVYKSYDYQ